jgi:large subunit ribosomal protein L25
MSEATLTAERRPETGSRPAGRYRRDGLVPAVVYGLGEETVAVTVPARELGRILTGGTGANTLITLQLDGASQLALARQIQRHPVKGTLVHVDFVRVRADQTIAAEVPLHLVGDSEGVKRGGLLDQLLFAVAVEAKPADVPASFEYDVTELQLGDQVHVRDLASPAGVTITNDPDELVAQVTVPRGREEGEAAEGEAAEGEGEAGEAATGGGAEAGADEAGE